MTPREYRQGRPVILHMSREATYADPIERHIGIPSRTYIAEDRAVIARTGARVMREIAYLRMQIREGAGL